MKTYTVQGHREINNVQLRHGDELPPGLLDDALRDKWLDQGWLCEHDSSERRSLHRLFPQFSGAEGEPEPLDAELKQFAV